MVTAVAEVTQQDGRPSPLNHVREAPKGCSLRWVGFTTGKESRKVESHLLSCGPLETGTHESSGNFNSLFSLSDTSLLNTPII